MNYQEAVFACQKILKYEATDTTFLDILPRMFEYADERIYTEFDFLCTLASQSVTLTANNRNMTLSSNIIVLQSLNVITPASTAPDAGTRNPLLRVGVDFINAQYPSSTVTTVPTIYAVIGLPTIGSPTTAGPTNILLGPCPDQNYTLEEIGTIRPDPLSETNTTTFTSTYCPELFIAACMVFGFGYQRDFGSQSDNPQAAVSWEAQYQALKTPALIEQLRVKSASVSWSPYIPTPPANAQRDRANAAPQA